MEGGANINTADAQGNTPYNIAVQKGHDALAKRLAELGANTSPPNPPVLTGDYLGDALPGDEVAILAKGIVSKGSGQWIHSTPVFSKDGNEVYWSASYRDPISYMKRVNGQWTMPKDAPFTDDDFYDEPKLSPDEKRLYFLSTKSIGDIEETRREFLWYVERDTLDDEWSEPKLGPAAINAHPLHWQYAIGPDGDFYLPIRKADGQGLDIYHAPLIEGEYPKVERLKGPVNSSGDDHMPFISPDNSYMVFAARNRPNSSSRFFLYISFRDENGEFGEPILLNDKINAGDRICPVITADGKFLFFIMGTDIGWTSTDFIEDLRPKL